MYILIFIMLAFSALADFPYHSNTGNFNATTNATGDFNAFSWQWMGYDDQRVNVNLLPTGYAMVYMRMCWPRRGTIFLEVTDGVLATTNFTASITRSNLPPNGVYYTEFIGFETTSTSSVARSLATGMINIQHSLFENTTQSTWTNPAAGTVIGPPIHTLSTLSLWPFVQTNQMGSGATWNGSQFTFGVADLSWSNNYYLASNPSNYCTLTAASALTNGFISSETLWIAASNTVVYTNDPRLTDNRTDGAAWHYGDSVTGAVDSVARGLTNYDAFGSALAVSNAFTNAATLALTALQAEADTLSTVLGRGAVVNVNEILLEPVATTLYLRGNTVDGADINSLVITPAGGSGSYTRGGYIRMVGNEFATDVAKGDVTIGCGDSTNSQITLSAGNTSKVIISSDVVNFNGSVVSNATYHGSGSSLTGITAAQVGALSTNGGALNGAVTTTRTDGWAGNELITADAVRGFLASGKSIYMTTNVFDASWSPTNTTTIGSYEPTAYSLLFTVNVVSAGHYLATLVDTNPVAAGVEMVGPATVVINIFTPSGAQTSLSVKPEIYYTYDLNATTLTLGDFDAAAQAITVGVTNAYTWSIAFASEVPTSTYYRVYRLKTTAKGNNTTTASIGIGGSIDSFVLYQQGADTLGSRGATNIVTGAANGYDSTTRTLTYAGLTNVTTEAVVAAGAITNSLSDPYMTPTNLLGLISGTTCTWTRAWGNAGYLTPTGSVYFAADATMTDTNGLVGFSLDLFYNGQTFGFVGASMTNTATLTSNAWNSIIFWKGYGATNFVGK